MFPPSAEKGAYCERWSARFGDSLRARAPRASAGTQEPRELAPLCSVRAAHPTFQPSSSAQGHRGSAPKGRRVRRIFPEAMPLREMAPSHRRRQRTRAPCHHLLPHQVSTARGAVEFLSLGHCDAHPFVPKHRTEASLLPPPRGACGRTMSCEAAVEV